MFRVRGMLPETLLRAALAGLRPTPWPRHLFLCVADHFEPDWNGAGDADQAARVARWVETYPEQMSRFEDSRGRPPQHTFFYPAEVYRPEQVDQLCRLVRRGFGDVEVHLHHDGDDGERMTAFLLDYTRRIRRDHGLLSEDRAGRIRFGFIHGNWALDNARPDGRWCGVNNELSVLVATGCYADFTFPSAPHFTQPRTLNSLYYAVDDPDLPNSHDTGVAVSVGGTAPVGGLLMIQGPLVLTTSGVARPRVENGNLSGSQPPDPNRIASWLRAAVTVRGREDWAFIKLHTHGAPERNAEVLLGEPMQRLHRALRREADQRQMQFYYVTAREMAQLVRQAEQGAASPDFDALGWDEPTDVIQGCGSVRGNNGVRQK